MGPRFTYCVGELIWVFLIPWEQRRLNCIFGAGGTELMRHDDFFLYGTFLLFMEALVFGGDTDICFLITFLIFVVQIMILSLGVGWYLAVTCQSLGIINVSGFSSRGGWMGRLA